MTATLEPQPLRAWHAPWAYAGAGFGLQAAWVTLAAFLPATLETFQAAPFVIGLVLALDPLSALVVAPVVGALSDRTRSPWGRRLPYIACGTAAAALGFVGLARAGDANQAIAAAACLCCALNAYLGPYRALLADEFEPSQHGWTSGLQSLAREAGGLCVLGAGAGWAALQASGSPALGPYPLAAAIVALSGAITCLGLGRPRRASSEASDDGRASAWRLAVGSAAMRRALLVLFGCWVAIEAGKVFVVLYLVHDVLGVAAIGSPDGQAAVRLAMGVLATISVTGLLASVPAGLASKRWGTRPAMLAGTASLAVGYGVAALATTLGGTYVAAVFCGIGLATLQVLCYPYVLQHKAPGAEGATAALYNQLVALAQLIALIAMGSLAQWTGSYRGPFWVGVAALAVASALLLRPTPPTPATVPQPARHGP